MPGIEPVCDGYRRAARRLRGRYPDDPARLHASLRRLSDEANRQVSRGAAETRPAAASAARLATEVAGLMDGPVLRYSNRLRLLRRAEQLGIERFEASLIIATVQHRQVRSAESTTPRRRWLDAMVLAAGVQALILTALWAMLR